MDPAILVDCSHSNSRRNHERQPLVLRSVLEGWKRHRNTMIGFMIESNLFSGNQEIPENLSDLAYGVSITDKCLDFPSTEKMLMEAYDSIGLQF